MNNDEVILTPGIIIELERSLQRNGWKRNDVHTICGGDLLGRMRKHMVKPAKPVASLKGALDRGPLFKPWKTITIGKRRSVDELLNALRDDEYEVYEEAADLLRQTTLEKVERQVNLAVLSLEDLNTEEPLHHSIMCRRIRHMGFELCTAEMIAELRLNFDDQEDLITLSAMTPVGGRILEPYLDNDEGKLVLSIQEQGECDNFNGAVDYICVIPQ